MNKTAVIIISILIVLLFISVGIYIYTTSTEPASTEREENERLRQEQERIKQLEIEKRLLEVDRERDRIRDENEKKRQLEIEKERQRLEQQKENERLRREQDEREKRYYDSTVTDEQKLNEQLDLFFEIKKNTYIVNNISTPKINSRIFNDTTKEDALNNCKINCRNIPQCKGFHLVQVPTQPERFMCYSLENFRQEDIQESDSNNTVGIRKTGRIVLKNYSSKNQDYTIGVM